METFFAGIILGKAKLHLGPAQRILSMIQLSLPLFLVAHINLFPPIDKTSLNPGVGTFTATVSPFDKTCTVCGKNPPEEIPT